VVGAHGAVIGPADAMASAVINKNADRVPVTLVVNLAGRVWERPTLAGPTADKAPAISVVTARQRGRRSAETDRGSTETPAFRISVTRLTIMSAADASFLALFETASLPIDTGKRRALVSGSIACQARAKEASLHRALFLREIDTPLTRTTCGGLCLK